MPFKLIGIIILLVLVTIFCGFNLGDAYRCDINFVFVTLHKVPAFLTVLISFFAGVLVMTPFTFIKKKMSREEIEQAAEKQKQLELKKAQKEERAKEKAAQKEKTLADHAAKKAEKEAQKAQKEQKAQKQKAKDVAKTEDKPSANDVPKIDGGSSN
ncbi:MAG: LapA family protein [Treponema sp.]|nr:LapA family protein [Treponema sp.]